MDWLYVRARSPGRRWSGRSNGPARPSRREQRPDTSSAPISLWCTWVGGSQLGEHRVQARVCRHRESTQSLAGVGVGTVRVGLGTQLPGPRGIGQPGQHRPNPVRIADRHHTVAALAADKR
jgi:hypothetical protein